ncbi:MAG: tRNA (adenosine(37)-N6)-threonylcarbamoyltransferase complex ATPase subunit type 1 TsaE [Thermodesulfovibrionales bacterium]|nr:tRNA (adenosine(37)-N6)-threonylcarbamoyltransferase complex ATPase subunit type 1 TsaE [Thermodesulfovibrionales bacterium]
MYENFYSLALKPFSKTPDPNFLFMSKAHEEALARMQYAVEEKELILLTGEVGCGKTTLTRALIDSLNEKHRVILILNPRLTPSQFLRHVVKRYDVEIPSNFKDSLLDTIYEKVYQDYEAGITPVIIIDEAQLVPDKQTFEEIRLLTNFQLDDSNMLSLILVGQPDLKKRLNHKTYFPLKQRIGLFYHVGPLAEDEIKGYMEHRIAIAGRNDMLFTDSAIRAMYKYSGGIPRIINNMATAALLEGFGMGRNLIDEPIIHAAAREVGMDPSRDN